MHHGDCRDVLAQMARDGVLFDACVTDPPYELAFMGRKWDDTGVAFDPATWRAVYDVMRPGAHLLAFGGTRTQHRLVCAIEDAGFEIRDSITWITGQGFPKSFDVSKAIDRVAGLKGSNGAAKLYADGREHHYDIGWRHDAKRAGRFDYTPATPEAAAWAGWGTALKPAHENICVARKPMDGTVAENVLRHGCGGLNIDASRVPSEARPLIVKVAAPSGGGAHQSLPSRQMVYRENMAGSKSVGTTDLGRWPANVIHDGSPEVEAAFAAFGERNSGGQIKHNKAKPLSVAKNRVYAHTTFGHGDTGSAARFFFSAKASAADRAGSKHPTVKPQTLMRHLCTLVTPPGGHVLDPFAGSGSTLQAALRCGFLATGIEREVEYVRDTRARLALPQVDDDDAEPTCRTDPAQRSLFP